MNRNFASSLITILAAAVVAFGVTRWTARAAPEITLDRMQDSEWLVRELNLTPDQATELKKLEQGYGVELAGSCERHCSARMQIGEELFHPDWNADKQTALAEQLCHAERDSELATLEHIRRVHSLLTAEQKKKYEALVTSCICSDCPNNLHTK